MIIAPVCTRVLKSHGLSRRKAQAIAATSRARPIEPKLSAVSRISVQGIKIWLMHRW